MSSVLFLSLAGSPGVTTTALAMTMTWPQSALLIEADTSHYSSILPGFLRAQVPHTRGIGELSVLSSNSGGLDLNQIWGQTISLVDDQPEGAAERRLVPGFKDPAAARAMDGFWAQLGSTVASFEGMGMDVLVDAGRWIVGDRRQALLKLADVVVIVARPTLSDVVATHVRLPSIREQLAAAGHEGSLALLVVEPASEPRLPSTEIRKALGLEPLGRIAWDEKTAPVFSAGESAARRFEKTSLGRSIQPAIGAIRAQLDRQRERLDENSSTTTEISR
ncbi:hypothetical protein C5D98_15020 [Rathayibacter rathayi]|uniref:hypothetical protein n=1 Tax=Rathayibacter rathayi TaxID=33887 RepID=UPI000CE76500|nr:hypothetical protein [Rathayibacter rathayi]PPG77493.1 hypothetical protein C5C15_09365 [Rathayibacter rathayi]PPG94329.1 hypothetical protein C5C22_09100 [Rathayibacter rathayi]PPI65261.1 hypothetical protein C5D98_15020 [Rathayibacter rathayi]